MSGLKKIFVIFTVAIILATISNLLLNKADAIDDEHEKSTSKANVIVDDNEKILI